ncbi:MAG TPA: hypothetical protein DDW89_01775 [Gammaproteobacteria bacterium]|nr:hypothetical protein [Gammaproteobacteria bacterium]
MTRVTQTRGMFGMPLGLALFAFGSYSPQEVAAFEVFGMDAEVSGYVRNHAAINLEDKKVPQNVEGEEIGGQGQLSMNRYQGLLNFQLDGDNVRAFVSTRYATETKTPYLKKLERASKKTIVKATPASAPVPVLSALGPVCQGEGALPSRNCAPGLIQTDLGGEFLDDYYDEGLVLREAYADFTGVNRLFLRLGRQQVVWGETDFFRITDIVHGYDQRWRSFFELENEELRKPSTLANLIVEVPELAGNLQLIYKPGGIDGSENYGNELDLAGGRYAGQPNWGVNITENIAPYNYHGAAGDVDDDEYGFRWSGTFGDVGYSLLFYRGLIQDPIANCRRTLDAGSTVQGTTVPFAVDINPACQPYKEVPEGDGLGGELIYARQSNYGGTFNYYWMFADAVLRGEFLYQPNRPWNYGTEVPITIPTYMPQLPVAGAIPLGWGTIDVPGLAGVIEKDTVTYMIGADKTFDLMRWLGTDRGSLATIQLIDQWIVDYDEDDDIVEVLSYGQGRDEHTVFLTASLLLNYRYDTILPSLAGGVNLNGADAFLIPAVTFVFGDHWRLAFEADLFFQNNTKKIFGPPENKTHVLGTTGDSSVFLSRLSYHF